MSEREEWGPWIEHDGAAPILPKHAGVAQVKTIGDGIAFSDLLQRDHPSWFWRWRRVRSGWFSWKRVRVCDNPAYAPIICYRIRKPRGMAILESILSNLPETVDA